MEHVNYAIEVLNRVHEADPTVLPALIFHRVPCNYDVANDSTVQVGYIGPGISGDEFEVGLLGIINGILGCHPETKAGFVVALVDDAGMITGFARNPKTI